MIAMRSALTLAQRAASTKRGRERIILARFPAQNAKSAKNSCAHGALAAQRGRE
jgi:hypothetical protein